MGAMDPQELIAALQEPSAWPEPPATVEHLQTHISIVFFVGEHVYKVKKELSLPFLDASTLERRRALCEEEVRLNARLAGDTYLGVVPIVRPIAHGASGGLRVGGEGEVAEWAVHMRRLPSERMLDQLLARGEVDNRLMNAIAERLARFHASADTGTGVDEYGDPDAVRKNVLDNFAQTEGFVGQTFPAAVHAFLRERAETRLADLADVLQRRVDDGRVRDGHGDLHGSNVCYLAPPKGAPEDADGQLVIYDCIEFSDAFRCGDVACDLAFLAMDLDHRGFHAFGAYLAHRYAAHANDPELEELLPFYKGYRAMVRAKVASLLSTEAEVPAKQRDQARRTALSYTHLASAYELPPALILMCGLPACGKTWVAERVAPFLDPCVLSSDVVRKRMAGIPLGKRHKGAYEDGIYSPEAKRRTYATLLERGLEAVAAGRTAVVDATFGTRAFRAPYIEAAERLGVPLILVHVHADEAVIAERMERRAKDPNEASDATFQVYLAARERFEAPDEMRPEQVVDYNSVDGVPEELGMAVVEARLRAFRALHGAPLRPTVEG